MTKPPVHDDHHAWLSALAGRAPDGIDSEEAAEASAVRLALTKRREAIEADAHSPSAEQFQRLRDRLAKEKLLSNAPATSARRPASLPQWLGTLGGGGGQGVGSLQRWVAVAAVVVGVAVVAFQLTSTGGPDTPVHEDVLRGGAATVLIVPDPQARLVDLRQGFDAAKVPYQVKQLPDGRLQLDVTANAAALEYLDSQRISPTVKDNLVRVVIQKP